MISTHDATAIDHECSTADVAGPAIKARCSSSMASPRQIRHTQGAMLYFNSDHSTAARFVLLGALVVNAELSSHQ